MNEVKGFEGQMNVVVENEDGFKLTKEHGFIVKEANKVLAFDIYESPEYGKTLLFGEQIFFLKFWDKEDLHKALDITTKAFTEELVRRNGKTTP